VRGVRRVRIALAATACCLAVTLSSAPGASAADPFFGLFGSNMSSPPGQLAADLDAQAATGAGTVRELLFWDRIERAPGVFDFRDTDDLITAATARGMTVLPVLVGTPSFHSTRPAAQRGGVWPPREPASIARFARELTRRYGRRGTFWRCPPLRLLCRRPYRPITAWQVWNEPDITSWWRTGVSPGAYAALLAEAHRGLKAGDPSAEVVLGGLTIRAVTRGGYLERLYDLGAARHFDTVALHPYAANVSGVVGVLRRARAIAVAKGDGDVPIRATEYGFATGGVREWVTTPACQAALVAATTRELAARRTELGLRSIVQFQWRDRSADRGAIWPEHAGLLYVDGRAKPSLAAFGDAVAGRTPAAGLDVAEACPAQFQR
jgi:hypothetical protein